MHKPLHPVSRDLALLIGRIAIAAVFIPAGFAKLLSVGDFIASLDARGVPYATVLAPLGATIEFLGGMAVLFGVQVRFAAFLLIVFTVIATLIAHRFWEFEGAARQSQQSQFLKNFAIIGGYVLLMATGSGRYSLERLWKGRDMRRLPGRRASDQAVAAS